MKRGEYRKRDEEGGRRRKKEKDREGFGKNEINRVKKEENGKAKKN